MKQNTFPSVTQLKYVRPQSSEPPYDTASWASLTPSFAQSWPCPQTFTSAILTFSPLPTLATFCHDVFLTNPKPSSSQPPLNPWYNFVSRLFLCPQCCLPILYQFFLKLHCMPGKAKKLSQLPHFPSLGRHFLIYRMKVLERSCSPQTYF